MDLQITANGQSVPVHDNLVKFDCELPARIQFQVSGKGEYDTLVDEHGNIAQDKFVKIERVSIDRMPVPKYIIESRLIMFQPYNIKHAPARTNYLAWNGLATIELNHNNSFDFFLDLYTN